MGLLSGKVSLSECELKNILTKIKHGDSDWQEVDRLLIVMSMLEHIGSTDAELRDQLIYTSFYRLIIESNHLESELLKELLNACLSELIFKGIGEEETDTVFTRAFSTLLIALILYRDNQENFLSSSTVTAIKENLITYMNQEKDLRGYVTDKGWAHSVAHVADTFGELVKNPKLNTDCYPEILGTLWNKILISKTVYVHDEEERLIIPILEMLDRGLTVQKIEELIQHLPIKLKNQKEQLESEKYWFLVFNVKTFLKSFYIKIHRNSKLLALQNSIEQALSKMC
ncbi:DUF2785 domain-containing protein [Jeotgalibacillus sp. ET6]|uniref:DUF2785 domain-containing protein n=1 Tax=Jeotgalibacillus sp. ET6 TaxID=3037260 RepID=UPI002418A512|nr:DUF2785 domain-containing protein [Jeotgalibacillus sp. ET6]MDG5472095.1 DUF2785 domain-containing protein [Jeotgalibacillus sp. ET6]